MSGVRFFYFGGHIAWGCWLVPPSTIEPSSLSSLGISWGLIVSSPSFCLLPKTAIHWPRVVDAQNT